MKALASECLVGDQSAGIDGLHERLVQVRIATRPGLSITSTGLPRASTSA